MTRNGGSSALSRWVQWRVWVQASFLLLWLDPLALRLHTVCGPVFHCYSCPLAAVACPIGVLANFSALHVVPFLAIGTLLVIGGLLGSLICGWVCPFGFLQDMVGRIPVRKFELPAWTAYGRYAVLAGLVVLVPFLWGESHALFFCRVCPAGALEGAVPNVIRQAVAHQPITWPSTTKWIILGAFLTAMLFFWRPWCTMLCPLGAVYSLCNHVSAFYLKVHTDRCTGCKLCHSACNHGLRPNERANDPRCIRCLECTQCDHITLANVFWDTKAVPAEEPTMIESNTPDRIRS